MLIHRQFIGERDHSLSYRQTVNMIQVQQTIVYLIG